MFNESTIVFSINAPIPNATDASKNIAMYLNESIIDHKKKYAPPNISSIISAKIIKYFARLKIVFNIFFITCLVVSHNLLVLYYMIK